jgi:tetratricopeptide (TPR) repeat protein
VSDTESTLRVKCNRHSTATEIGKRSSAVMQAQRIDGGSSSDRPRVTVWAPGLEEATVPELSMSSVVTRLRKLPRTTVFAVCGALLALVLTLMSLLDAPTWARIVGAVSVLGLALASEADKHRTARLEKVGKEQAVREAAEEKERKWVREARSALRIWPAPEIADADPELLGITPSRWISHSADDPTLTRYVPRAIDSKTAERLRSRGAVLLVGEPASGMTRTAYELALADPTRRNVLAPRPTDGLRIAVNELEVLSRLTPTRLLLWLDDIADHSTDGLNRALLDQCKEESPRLRVIATIRAPEYQSWRGRQPEVAAFFGDPLHVRRLPTPEEKKAAELLFPDIDFSQGIAAAFTGTGALLDRRIGGNSTCPFEPPEGDCPLSRALIDIAIGWYACGTPRPLTKEMAARLAQHRVPTPDHDRDAHIQECLQWAMQPVTQGVSLLSMSEENGTSTLTVHSELAEVVIEAAHEPDDAVWIAALDEAEAADDSDAVGRIGYQAHTAGHMALADNAWNRVHGLDEAAAAWIRRAWDYSQERDENRSSLRPGAKYLALVEQSNSLDPGEISVLLNRLGAVTHEAGNARQARTLYERAIAMQEREYRPDHRELVKTLTGLGRAWNALGEPTKARQLCERALAIQESEYGSEDHELGRTLIILGNTWSAMGDLTKALQLYERALALDEREYGPEHPAVARDLNSLGATWSHLGEPTKALQLCERALTIQETEYGPEDRVVSSTLNNLGNAWSDLGEPTKARQFYERALTIKQREFGPDHRELVVTLHNLGNIWSDLGEPTKALQLYERALAIKEREFGPDHRELADTLNNLGNVWSELGQPAKAREVLERALAIKEREYGPQHRELAVTLLNLGNTWNGVGESIKARQLYERGLSIARAEFPKSHPLLLGLIRVLRHVAPDLLILEDGTIVGDTGGNQRI